VLRDINDGTIRVIGTFGILHPEVLKTYDVIFPTSVVEIDLEPLM